MPLIFHNIYLGGQTKNDFFIQSTINAVSSSYAKGIIMPALINVPLPTWRNLASVMLGHSQSDIELSAPWRRPGDTGFWLSRSAWSLLAIAQCWQRLRRQNSITVWVPDFFCNASLAPLRNIGVQLQFYPLTDQMAPDFDVCQTMAETTSPDLFVFVHYFGKPTSAENAVAFCREKHAWLIEDAAHVLRPVSEIGEYGDFVMYSPHKHLPIPDGALLLVRESGPARLMDQASTMETLQEVYNTLINAPKASPIPVWLWLFKRVLQRIGIRNWRSTVFPFFQDIDAPNCVLEHPKLSSLAKRLLSSVLDSLNSIASRRAQNSLLWEDVLAKSGLLISIKESTSINFTPYFLGVIFHDDSVAEKAFLRCQSNGLPVTTWPDLPPEVMAQKDQHKNALLFRNTRIYLQVHQPLTYPQTEECISNLQYEMNNV